jgi:hypothetical protein
MIAPPRAATAMAPLIDEPYPSWVVKMFPAGVPDELLSETPMSDAQCRYLAVLGVRNRWCSRDEAKQLISRIKRGQKAARPAKRRLTTHEVGLTP